MLGSKKWAHHKAVQTVPDQPGIKASDALGRVYTVDPKNFELFYPRLLLHEVKGPTSFEDLQTVDATICETYKQDLPAQRTPGG